MLYIKSGGKKPPLILTKEKDNEETKIKVKQQ
jgi:hypothetical protein